MVTKKDFIAVAEIISSNRGDGVEYTLTNIASELTDYFEKQNPNFNRDKFVEARGCNV